MCPALLSGLSIRRPPSRDLEGQDLAESARDVQRVVADSYGVDAQSAAPAKAGSAPYELRVIRSLCRTGGPPPSSATFESVRQNGII